MNLICIFYNSYLKSCSYKRKAGTMVTIHYEPIAIHFKPKKVKIVI